MLVFFFRPAGGGGGEGGQVELGRIIIGECVGAWSKDHEEASSALDQTAPTFLPGPSSVT